MILPFDKIAGYLAGERLIILQVRTLEERVDASKMTRRYSEELSQPKQYKRVHQVDPKGERDWGRGIF